jgi:hypothetical protein
MRASTRRASAKDTDLLNEATESDPGSNGARVNYWRGSPQVRCARLPKPTGQSWGLNRGNTRADYHGPPRRWTCHGEGGANFDPAGKSEDGPADLGRLLGSRRNGSVVELNHATWSAFLSLTAYQALAALHYGYGSTSRLSLVGRLHSREPRTQTLAKSWPHGFNWAPDDDRYVTGGPPTTIARWGSKRSHPLCHLSVFAGIYARNLLFRLFGGKSATLSIKSLISQDIAARQWRGSHRSPYFAREIKIHQKMSTKIP